MKTLKTEQDFKIYLLALQDMKVSIDVQISTIKTHLKYLKDTRKGISKKIKMVKYPNSITNFPSNTQSQEKKQKVNKIE